MAIDEEINLLPNLQLNGLLHSHNRSQYYSSLLSDLAAQEKRLSKPNPVKGNQTIRSSLEYITVQILVVAVALAEAEEDV